ncbi:MAG: hypothetical protein DRQ49_11185 [Gammaproteobacteria bacterium]|nr:MAG: hypothetical protein DRQ49_11185 [Gammaproteobacteria bacterium]RKZ43229.1 MAG: hypothetical protein DRQ41_05800 [Gammaproteobacteria bacterium]
MSINTPHHSRFFWRSSAMFSILDSEGKFKEVNSAWENTLGLSTAGLLAKPFLDFVQPDDKTLVQYYFTQLDEGLPSISFSIRFRHYDNTYRHILWEISGAASAEYAYYAVGMDVTIREQPQIADEMLSVLEEGVILQYANGAIGTCNPSAERILGLSADQMMGWTLVDADWRLVHEDGTPFPTETHPAICTLRTGQSYNDVVMGIVKPDESVIWIRIHTYPLWRDDVTMPYAVVISFSDITSYKETEQTLRKNLATSSGYIPENNYDLWNWDFTTNEMHFSARWEKMLGFEEHELLQHINSWHQRIHPTDHKRVMEDIQTLLTGLTPMCENTHRLQHKDGSYRWILNRAVMVQNSSGEPLNIVGTHVDMTEPHHIEDELHETELKYQQLMEVESDAIFMIDADTIEILDVNKATTHLYGYSRNQLLKLPKMTFSAQPDKTEQMIKKAIKSTSIQYHKKQNETVFPVEVTTCPFSFQDRQVLMMAVRDISERQKMESALWENESKYRQLFEAASNPTVVFDTNTQQIFDVNQAAVDLYGYSKNEWLQMRTEEVSAEQVKKRGTFGSGHKRHVIPLRWHKKKDGTVFPVEIASGNSYLFQGRSLVCTTLRDITERKAYEEALRQERDFVQSLIQASPAFFITINPDGKIRMINQAMLQATGYSLAEVEQADFITFFVSTQEQSLVSTEISNLIKSMQPSLMECHVKSKSGQSLLVEWHSRAVVKANGVLDYFFGVGIDVTKRKKAEVHLHLFKSIIETSEEAITIRDAQGQLMYINQAYEKLFGYSFQEAKLNNLFDTYPIESKKIWKKEVIPALASGNSWEGELDAFYNDGSQFPIWQRVDAVRNAEGKILFRFGLMHDISERKRMWDMLRKQWQEYQMIFNTVPAMIWYRDKNNHLIRQNKRATEVFKNHEQELEKYTDCQVIIQVGRPQSGIVHSLKVISENMADSMGKEAVESQRWLQFDKIPYRNATGNLIGVIVFAIDITEYKKPQSSKSDRFQQQSYHDNEAFLTSLFDVAKLGICVTDDQGRFLQVNQAFTALYGYRTQELIGQPFTMILPPSARDDAVREYYSLLVTQEKEMFIKRRTEQHRNGQLFEVQMMGSRVIFKERGRMLVSIISQI